MRVTKRQVRVASVAALTSGLVGLSLLGAGAFAMEDGAADPTCPEGSFLYRLATGPEVGIDVGTEAGTGATTTTDGPTVTGTIVGPVEGSPEAQTDPFVAPGAPDPESFVCIANGEVVPAVPALSPAAIPATPTPTPEPPLQPAPGMIGLPGSGPSDVPSDVPTPIPSVTPPAALPDVPSDSAPDDLGGGGGTVVVPGPVGGPPDLSGSITRDEVIARAVSWVLQGVPYSQTSWWTDSNGTYRQDCSGYVSMAWRLDQRTNYWTGNLATVSHRVATNALKMGDVLLLPRRHVVIFAGWANSARTKFHLFEEYSRGKPARYLTNADLSYYTDRGYGAYRYDRIADVAPGKAGSQKTVYLSAYAEPAKDPDRAEQELADTAVSLEALHPVAWSQDLADQADAEEFAPSASIGIDTPEPVPDLPLETLVEAQRATDLRAGEAAPSSGAGTVLIAGGLGLLFLAFPLAGAARAGVWTRQYGQVSQP